MTQRNETYVDGPTAMIHIDGDSIRRFREEKGLTQLYIATAVGVTTDTVSRWENRRYPSIKKENGVRLAEALGVELSAILEGGSGQKDQEQEKASDTVRLGINRGRGLRHLIAGCFLILMLCVVVGIWLMPQGNDQLLIAYRVLPERTAPGLVFPVVLEVLGHNEEPQSVIVKELLPAGAQVEQAFPAVTSSGKQGRELKWLQKIKGRTRFVYLVKFRSTIGDSADFGGSVSVGRGGVVAVQGKSKMIIDQSHWADRDGDRKISDPEILFVYDQFGDSEGIDFALIEKIWSGSGYQWNREKEGFEVLP